MFLVVLAFVLPRLPMEELAETAGDVLAGTASAEELEQVVALTIDALIPLDAIIPGPLGVSLERVDDVIIQRVVSRVASLATRRARNRVDTADGAHPIRSAFRRLFRPREVSEAELSVVPIPAAE